MDKKDIEVLEQKTEAIKGLWEISNYMTISPNLTSEAVNSFNTLKEWLFNEQ